MSIYPFHLQQVSKNIFDNRDILSCSDLPYLESVYRTVVNRSYYAAYSHMKIWAKTN